MEVLFFPGSGETLADATAQARERFIKWYLDPKSKKKLGGDLQFSTSSTQNNRDFIFVITVFIIDNP